MDVSNAIRSSFATSPMAPLDPRKTMAPDPNSLYEDSLADASVRSISQAASKRTRVKESDGEPAAPSTVIAYQADKLAPSTRGHQGDLFVSGSKVVLLGKAKQEFAFDEALGSDVRPDKVADRVLRPLASSLVRGVNGVLFVLGSSTSGKEELLEGLPASAGNWKGLADAMINEVYSCMARARERTTHRSAAASPRPRDHPPTRRRGPRGTQSVRPAPKLPPPQRASPTRESVSGRRRRAARAACACST